VSSVPSAHRGRWLATVLTLCVVGAAAFDARQAPAARWSTHAALTGIRLYQATLSPLYARIGVQCRFTLSCSHYGAAVVERYGVVRGGWLGVRRVARCGPWTPAGTVDPPPSS